jgi:hypothetical protein
VDQVDQVDRTRRLDLGGRLEAGMIRVTIDGNVWEFDSAAEAAGFAREMGTTVSVAVRPETFVHREISRGFDTQHITASSNALGRGPERAR